MTADVSFAGVPLHRGDRIEARVWDRDVTGDERIDTLTGRFEGTFPIALAHGETTITCELGDGARGGERDGGTRAAEPLRAALEHGSPDLAAPGLGRANETESTAAAGIALAMAYAGLTMHARSRCGTVSARAGPRSTGPSARP